MDVSRRDFFKGTALTSVAAAAAAAGVTVTAPTAANAAADIEKNPYLNIYDGEVNYLPVKKVSDDWPLPQGKPAFEDREIGEDEIRRTDTCDFLVIGAGISGIMATLKASDEGANVICVEKMSRGRNTWESIGAAGTKAQAEAGQEIDKPRLVDAFLRVAYFRPLPEVVWSYVNNSGEAVDYMQEKLDESDYDIKIFNTTQPETGYDLVTMQIEHKFDVRGPMAADAHIRGMYPMAALTTLAESRENVDLRVFTAGVQLTQDETGRVTGAIVKDDDGYYRIEASAGVLLATGGYENNFELLKAWMRPEDYARVQMHGPCLGCTGDGHMMGLKVGADMDPVPHAMMTFSGGIPSDRGRNMPIVQPCMAMAPMVNGKGRRFCNEGHQKDFLSNAINTQVRYNKGVWYIFDQTIIDLLEDPSVLDQYLASGDLYRADTLEELAEMVGISADTLVKTIDTWNGYFEQGLERDPEFNRDLTSINTVVEAMSDGKIRAGAMPVQNGPFWAMPTCAKLFVTVSGLIINEDCQVMSTKGEVIPGLYASGDTSGGMYSSTYPRHLPANAVGHSVTFGYVAARTAMRIMKGE